MFFFQLPLIPEKALSMRHYRRIIGAIRKSARKGTFSEKNIEEFRESLEPAGRNDRDGELLPGRHAPGRRGPDERPMRPPRSGCRPPSSGA